MEGPIHGCFSQGCHGPHPPDIGRSENPIQTKGGADYGHHNLPPSGLSDLPAALHYGFPASPFCCIGSIEFLGEYIVFYNLEKHKMSESLPFEVGMIQ